MHVGHPVISEEVFEQRTEVQTHIEKVEIKL